MRGENWSELDQSLRNGHVTEVATRLSQLDTTKLDRDSRVRFGELAYRCGLPFLGLRVLNGQVRRASTATDAEKTHYAGCLARLGGAEEALRILGTVDSRIEPRALLVTAGALMTRWRHQAAIEHLKTFLASEGADEYWRYVAEVNLVASLLFTGRHVPARAGLTRLMQWTSLRKLWRLRGNTLELAAQFHVGRREWALAELCLREASSFVEAGSTEGLFIQKWRAITSLLRDGDRGALDTLRKIAQKVGHWETVREADRYLANATKDQELFWRVYFGTPYPEYRRVLLREFRSSVAPPASFRWHPLGEGGPSINLVRGARMPSGKTVPRSLARLLATLVRDHYAPIRIVELCHQLFPDERFNPETAPPRVHELARRLRASFEEESVPLSIETLGNAYQLRFDGPVTIDLPNAGASEATPIEERLELHFAGTPFSPSEAAQALGRPLRTVQRELARLLDAGQLERQGKARAVRYRCRNHAK